MLEARKWRERPHHAETRLEQRLIERLAVVRDQNLELLQMLGQRGKNAGLFAVVAHEELPYSKSVRCDAAYADQKCVCARAAGEPSCFGIEERPLLGWRGRNLAVRDRKQQIMRKVRQIGNADAPVPLMPLIELLHLPVAAEAHGRGAIAGKCRAAPPPSAADLLEVARAGCIFCRSEQSGGGEQRVVPEDRSSKIRLFFAIVAHAVLLESSSFHLPIIPVRDLLA